MNIITKPRNKKYDSVLNLKAHSWGSLYTACSSGFNAPALVPYSNSEIIDLVQESICNIWFSPCHIQILSIEKAVFLSCLPDKTLFFFKKVDWN